MGPVVLEIELAAGLNMTAGDEPLDNWAITDVMISGDVVDVSADLLNAYTKHLEEGRSLPYSFGTFSNVEHAIAKADEFSVN